MWGRPVRVCVVVQAQLVPLEISVLSARQSLANNLTCRYRGQICLHAEIQNEAVSLLSYLSLNFQNYTVE